MTLRPLLTICLTLALCGMILAASGRRTATARADARAARGRLVAIQADLREVERLRARDARAQLGDPPGEDLLARVRATLDRADVSADRLQRLARRGDSAIAAAGGSGGVAYRTRHELLSLDRVTPPELGRFLAEWRLAEPLWTVTTIDMRETRGHGSRPGTYVVQITLTTTYVQTAPEPTP